MNSDSFGWGLVIGGLTVFLGLIFMMLNSDGIYINGEDLVRHGYAEWSVNKELKIKDRYKKYYEFGGKK